MKFDLPDDPRDLPKLEGYKEQMCPQCGEIIGMASALELKDGTLDTMTVAKEQKIIPGETWQICVYCTAFLKIDENFKSVLADVQEIPPECLEGLQQLQHLILLLQLLGKLR
jgi:hypothetical protein